LYRARSLESETPPNSNVLSPVVLENEASTPLTRLSLRLNVPPVTASTERVTSQKMCLVSNLESCNLDRCSVTEERDISQDWG
jgi:hypothetical protein